MNIVEQLKEILSNLPKETQLVAVSKFHSTEEIRKVYDAGQRIFGESKVQELENKHTLLPTDIAWHFIGHLQTNKVKYIAPYIAMIHAVDSYKLLQEIDKQAKKHNRVIPCLLEIHIAQEESKYGFSFDECKAMLDSSEWKELKHACICGLMGMATFTDNESIIKREFETLQQFFQELKATHFSETPTFKELSIGMSDDYRIALEYGSTMVRIGSKIFGARNY